MAVVYCLVVKGDNIIRSCQSDRVNFPVAMRPGVTPVPIPNTMVKAWAAESTALETMWEDRRPPEIFKKLCEQRLDFLRRLEGSDDCSKTVGSAP